MPLQLTPAMRCGAPLRGASRHTRLAFLWDGFYAASVHFAPCSWEQAQNAASPVSLAIIEREYASTPAC